MAVSELTWFHSTTSSFTFLVLGFLVSSPSFTSRSSFFSSSFFSSPSFFSSSFFSSSSTGTSFSTVLVSLR